MLALRAGASGFLLKNARPADLVPRVFELGIMGSEVPERFGRSLNFETDDVDWVAPDAVTRRPLHAGFAAAWPFLRAIVDAAA